MQPWPKWNPLTTPDYWQYLAEKSGINPSPWLIRYMKWRETPAEMREPKTQAEFSKQMGISEDTLETSFLFLFQRAFDEWLWGD